MKTAHFKITELGRRVSKSDETSIQELFKGWERFGCFESRTFPLFVKCGGRMLVARDKRDAIIGTVSLSPGIKPTWPWNGEVGFVRVKDCLKSQGIGRALMNEVEALAIKLLYSQVCLNSSREARGFYERLGYKLVKGNRYQKQLK